MRKIYLVPNFITTLNLFFGFYSIIQSLHYHLIVAAWSIVAAGVCDMLDGRIARLAKATSPFGVEYDSLSDLISFGVAPACLLYQWVFSTYDRFGCFLAFLFLTCGAFRLARFNVNCSTLSKNDFQGLPIPIAGGWVATALIFNENFLWLPSPDYVMIFMSILLSGLMVSTIPFPSFKVFNWRSKASFGYLMLILLMMILVAMKPEILLFLLLTVYLMTCFFSNLYYLLKERFNKNHSIPSPGSPLL